MREISFRSEGRDEVRVKEKEAKEFETDYYIHIIKRVYQDPIARMKIFERAAEAEKDSKASKKLSLAWMDAFLEAEKKYGDEDFISQLWQGNLDELVVKHQELPKKTEESISIENPLAKGKP